MIKPEKYIKFNDDEVVIKKTEYEELQNYRNYIEYMKEPTLFQSMGRFFNWAADSKTFDKCFTDEEFKKHWFGMKKRLDELELSCDAVEVESSE